MQAIIRERSVENQSKSKTLLANAVEKLKCGICKPVYNANEKKNHYQSLNVKQSLQKNVCYLNFKESFQ